MPKFQISLRFFLSQSNGHLAETSDQLCLSCICYWSTCEMTFENHPLQIVLPKPSKFQVTMWTSLTLQHLLRQGLERGPTSALRPHHINDPSTKPVSASGFCTSHMLLKITEPRVAIAFPRVRSFAASLTSSVAWHFLESHAEELTGMERRWPRHSETISVCGKNCLRLTFL